MIKIKFTAQGSNALVGGFSHSTEARVDEALADHLVHEAKVAVYVDAAPAVKPAAKAVRKPAAKK